ncbi:MFS drug efflux transporter [Niveomyces insectorum RCEF 264]|uniref:MFS drug efflux transporter n=1 Tax=Niveomyces insectorum RCEF 264 TaxID=1081102 RepID=A0A162ML83_9HYPO|nr:MFS drug efflux transporter [Niveomyces insectorum RCEF 264]
METPTSFSSIPDVEKRNECIQAGQTKPEDQEDTTTDHCLARLRSLRRSSHVGDRAPDSNNTAVAAAAATDNDHGPGTITGFRWILVCIALYLSTFMYGLDTTIAADVQSAVVETYGTVGQLAWLGAGFPLGSIAVGLPYGSLFTHFNMKWAYIGGIVLFEVGSALCGGAPSMHALIVGRVIAGAGGAGMYLGGLTHFSALTTPRYRGTYITGIVFVWGIGSVLGPVVGGAFSDSSATWRWAFYLNLVIGAATAPIYLFYLPSVRPPGVVAAEADGSLLPVRARIARLDFVGFILSGAAWVTLALGLVSAGSEWAWSDGRTIATLTVFGVLFVGYVLQQYFCWFTTPATRSFPGHLIAPGSKNARTHVLLYIGTSASITTMFVPTYYIPVYFQFVQNDTALMAAVRLLPFVLVAVSANLTSSFLLRLIKYYTPVYLGAGMLITLSSALLYVYLEPGTSVATIYGLTVLGAVGTGISVQAGFQVATLVVDDAADMGHAISMQNVSQIGSTVLALVVAGQVFQSVAITKLSAVLAGYGFTHADIQSAVAGTRSTLFESLEPELRARAIRAVTEAVQATYLPVLAAGALLVVVGACMRWEKLDFGEVVAA